jgi:hypothetical protein
MNCRKELKLNGDHLQDRAFERNAPLDELKNFDPKSWCLVIVEVRADTGKFVSTVWEVETQGSKWWVVIGLHDTIKSVYPVRGKTGLGSDIVRSGQIFDFVRNVNQELMDSENKS